MGRDKTKKGWDPVRDRSKASLKKKSVKVAPTYSDIQQSENDQRCSVSEKVAYHTDGYSIVLRYQNPKVLQTVLSPHEQKWPETLIETQPTLTSSHDLFGPISVLKSDQSRITVPLPNVVPLQRESITDDQDFAICPSGSQAINRFQTS